MWEHAFVFALAMPLESLQMIERLFTLNVLVRCVHQVTSKETSWDCVE